MSVNEDLFHLGIENSISLSSPAQMTTIQSDLIFQRNVHGVVSALLAFKRRPSQIRFQGASALARRLAMAVTAVVEKDDVFEFRRQDGPLLLILDRKDDPITPLLTQWTYQAMVHELLGLNYNRVNLKDVPKITPELLEVVLSSTSDPFFAKNINANFGDLATNVKSFLGDYQRKAKMNENLTTIQDMQAVIERYPAFRAQAINVSKHVTIMGELSRLTGTYQLFDISQLEQAIANNPDHGKHRKELLEKITSSAIQPADKLRLALLYVLRYESYDEADQIRGALVSNGMSGPPKMAAEDPRMIRQMLEYAGETKRAQGLFGGVMSRYVLA
jgi:vacuolar protein sorting-associated protein 45